MKPRAATRAASQRVGAMSCALIEPDVSMQSITVTSFAGTRAVKRGPASARASVATPTSQSAIIAIPERRDGCIAPSAKGRLE